MNATNLHRVAAAAAAALILLPGCSSDGARVVTNDRELITTVNRIDIQDWQNAASELLGKLLRSDALSRSPQQPAPIQVSQIINNTTQNVDTSLLVNKILSELNRSGKANAFTQDKGAREESDYQRFMKNDKEILPVFILSGKIIQDVTRADSTRQSSFVFQLALTEAASGLNVWQDEKTITKQGSKASVGF